VKKLFALADSIEAEAEEAEEAGEDELLAAVAVDAAKQPPPVDPLSRKPRGRPISLLATHGDEFLYSYWS